MAFADFSRGASSYGPTGILDFLGGQIGAPTDYLSKISGFNALADSGRIGANGVGMPTIGGSSGLGLNMGTANLALSGLGTIGNLYAAFQAQNLAKKQFQFTKKIGEANLANSVASYNTTLMDRARSRGKTEGQTQQQTDEYIQKNRLPG